MSKNKTVKTIRSEIDRLNQKIDLCIIQGVPYKRLSLRHRFLRSQLSRLAPIRSTWFSKSLSFISTFMF